MKVYKIEIMVIDFDNLGASGIKSVLEETRYANRCLDPKVVEFTRADIEWSDDHPLNNKIKWREAYRELFREYPDPDWND